MNINAVPASNTLKPFEISKEIVSIFCVKKLRSSRCSRILPALRAEKLRSSLKKRGQNLPEMESETGVGRRRAGGVDADEEVVGARGGDRVQGVPGDQCRGW